MMLRMRQSVGIIGGRPRQSLFFVGFQDESVIYLDPHTVRPAVKLDQEFSPESYHCRIPQKMAIENIDPSLAVGFYCGTSNEFAELCSNLQMMNANCGGYPIITIAHKPPDYERKEEPDLDDAVVL